MFHSRRSEQQPPEQQRATEETIKFAVKQTKRNGKLVRAKRTSIVCSLQIHEQKDTHTHTHMRQRLLFDHSGDNKMCNKNNHET